MWHEIVVWSGFLIFIIAMLILDLGVFQRKAHTISVKESLWLTCFWIGLALLFNLGIYYFKGKQTALEFLTGYLIEKSLSIDNIFVFLLIFSYFHVPSQFQHKILFWGILGAIIFRGVFILVGLSLIHQFNWLIYFFGALLVWTGFKMFMEKERKIAPEKNRVVKLFRKVMPVAVEYEGSKFFTRKDKKWYATPLLIVLIVVESTDIIFAVDSIPAIFAITLDPFIVYTSNILAILGLRALYFTLAGLMQRFHLLSYGLSIILVFIGIKMLISGFFHLPIGVALGFIASALLISMVTSILWPPKPPAHLH
ncbi:MAG: TerC family protein [Candidatus Omnitrophica bacterium]|nr:TerC family protein [Candidatus Omnitrophota bacterium]